MSIPPPRRLVLLGILLAQVGCADFLGLGGDDGLPTVEAVTPDAGASGVSVLASVTVRFSAGLDSASLSSGARLESAGRIILVEASLSDDRTLTLAPRDPLDFGTEYRVVLTSSLLSDSGLPMEGTTSWTFTTEGLAPPVPNQDTLEHHLEVLAHDTMGGRGSGSEDELRAARYLESRFMAYGLDAPLGGVVQPFEAQSRRGDTLVSSRNVLAEVRGSGALANEWLVVGAHYDHIGFRGLDDDSQGPNNGADDNGSGTVLMLELARMLQGYVDDEGMAGVARRSVLFIGFGAEEEGLLGSCHYVFEAPAAPLASTRAMMNFDMVGRLRNGTLVVSGQETASEWAHIVANANVPELNLFRPETSSTGGTDHACFWRAGVPWVGFFTDFHPEYHRPGDDVELINISGMARIGELGFRILTRLLVLPEPPAFTGPIPELAG